MANIAISEIQTTATTLNDGDYFLISRANENNPSSFISAKIRGSVIKNSLNNLTKSVKDGDVIVYISPSGNDDNLQTQFEKFGTTEQINYPLYTINAAVAFLSRFRKIYTTSNIGINYKILCENGTYTYTEQQVLSHPDCCHYGNYISIAPRIFSNTDRVTFIFENNSYEAFFLCMCNVSFYYLKITESTINFSKIAFVTYTNDLRLSGCEVYNMKSVVNSYTSSGTITITSYERKTNYTLDTIETDTYPSYFHDIANIALIVTRFTYLNMEGFLRFKNCLTIASVYYTTFLKIGSQSLVTRIDISCNSNKKILFEQNDFSNIVFYSDKAEKFELNYWNSDTTNQYTNRNELFQVAPNQTAYNSRGRLEIGAPIDDCFHIVNKF